MSPARATIVMYHYVRDLQRSRYPRIKGLNTSAFREQVSYLRRHYQFVSVEECIAAVEHAEPLPPRAVLLTFDDGYLDHFDVVLPVLDECKIRAAFFPAGQSVLEGKVLDVNKIHFVLAANPDVGRLVKYIYDAISELRERYDLESPDSYYQRLAVPSRFDPAEVIFVKRVLQRGLPLDARKEILDRMFCEFVTRDESAFAAELYMSVDQLKYLVRNGMTVGSHGYFHHWFDALDGQQQAAEVDRSLAFLKSLGVEMTNWVMSYPNGAYDQKLLTLLRQRGCKLGFGTKVGVASITRENSLTLERLDTVDLPTRSDAPVCDWTHRAFEQSFSA